MLLALATAPRRVSFLGLDPDLTRGLLLSLAVVGLAVVIRLVGGSIIRRSGLEGENLLRLRASTRNAALAVVGLGLFVIWAEELQAVALSLVAIAAATAIATKEIITCVVGTVYRGSMRPYAIGDRVSIGDVRGDVLDISLLATRIREVRPTESGDMVTGRVVVLPNSGLFEHEVRNESADGPFVVDEVSVQSSAEAWRDTEARLLQAARRAVEGFEADAQAAFDAATQRLGAPPRQAVPRCEVSVRGRDEVTVHLYHPAPLARRGQIRQAVWRGYLGDEDDATGTT